MSKQNSSDTLSRVTGAGMLISIGVVFGDLGTSPLYTLPAILRGGIISRDIVLGSLSAVIWTLTLLTSVKYILLTLRADNQGEGGIFSLYTLVWHGGRWLLWPAIIGGASLLADGILTPPISVASAIEGLHVYFPQLDTVPIVIAILLLLFFFQQFGTDKLGRAFGPVMVAWFLFIGAIGSWALIQYGGGVLVALNPMYAIRLLTDVPEGFWLLGGVFLCATGAEALYADMSHCGRGNIRASWIFIKVLLILSYAGQCAWLLSHEGERLGNIKPFYAIVPEAILPFAIGLATLATIIASQALISGCFTLVNEAIRLQLWPRHKVVYPTNLKGQLYIPAANLMLCVGCIGVVLHFRESQYMEAAFGLAVTITMLSTTVLIAAWLRLKRYAMIGVLLVTAVFVAIELSFLVANMKKFPEGGWISILIGTLLLFIMVVWHNARKIRSRFVQTTSIKPYFDTISSLSADEKIPKYATHLVYLTASNSQDEVELKVMHSILNRTPKRADIYWFLHVEVLDEPYGMRYQIYKLLDQDLYYIRFKLGFRIEPRLNMFFRMVVEEMVAQKEVDITSRYHSLQSTHHVGDFRFVVQESFLSYENELSPFDKITMGAYMALRGFSQNEQASYGLDLSNVTVEKVPMIIKRPENIELVRENVERKT